VKPEAIRGRHIRELLGPSLYALNRPHIEAALRGELQEFEREIPDPAGGPPRHAQARYIPDVVDGVVRGFCVLVVDITRRKRAEDALLAMERRLLAAERLSALGTLAAGIAHEINNPLAAVLANLELALADVARGKSDGASMTEGLVEARDSAMRVREIVKSMRLFARGDATKRAAVDINETLERSVGFASNTLRYRARLTLDLREVGHVDANASELSQVFVNLLTNASQSFNDDRAETNEIRLTTRREGSSIVVEVGDNGCGIPDELQSRIFEPFFTTKDVGVGMGLGLSISSGIVAGLGGTISVRSKVGEGTVFRIVLPTAPSPPPDLEQPETRRGAVESPPGRRAQLLIVDDEPLILKTLARVLERDCDVTTVGLGRDAISLLLADPSRFDMVLCDLMMPGVTGADVYAEIATTRPELARRFVFMTGGAFTPKSEAFLASVQVPVLAKPFDIERLRQLVQQASLRTRT
jgi:signal transduction histidine kinase/ActR/RegA family two-component response regulator